MTAVAECDSRFLILAHNPGSKKCVNTVVKRSMAGRRDIKTRNPAAFCEDLDLASKSLRCGLVPHRLIQRSHYGAWENLNAIEFLFQTPKELKPRRNFELAKCL